jgi:hypothetical protein
MSTSTSGSTILTEVGGTPAAVQGATGAAVAPDGTAAASGAAPAVGSKAWWAEFEGELGKEPGFEKVKSYSDTKGIAKAYMNLEKLLGGEKVPKPRADDDVEGWERWHRASGRPDKAEEYEFKRPDSLPDGFYSEDIEKEFRTWVHENGLNRKQAANLHDRYVATRLKAHIESDKARQEQRSQAETALKRQFGDKYEAAQSRTKSAYQKYATPEFAKLLEETGLGNDPRMIQVFEKIGADMMGETRLKGQGSAESTPADLKRSIADFRAKFNDALHKREHPDHKLRTEQFTEMFQKLHPE